MKLSIITINYNNCEGLRKTIDSVVSQIWQEFEWIIVDGGSTDGSRELIEQTASKLETEGWVSEQFSGPEEPAAYIAGNKPSNQSAIPTPCRLRWCSEKDSGVYNAMNKGIVRSKGEFLSFMNSGDVYLTNKTLKQVFSMELWGDVIYGDWTLLTSDREELIEAPKDSFEFLVHFQNVCHQAMFIRSNMQKEHLYDESFRVLADWKLWKELPSKGFHYQYVPITVCRFWAECGLSTNSNYKEQIVNEITRIQSSENLPYSLRTWLLKYNEERINYTKYEDSYLIRELYEYLNESNLYRYLIHGLAIILRASKRIRCVLRLK